MAKTVGRDAVISLVLRKQAYKCSSCGVPQHAMVVRQSGSRYMVCDKFESEFMKSKGRTVFKVHLRLNFLDGNKENFAIDNLVALCPACTQEFLKSLKKDFRAIALENRIGLNIGMISSVKNFIMQVTGQELSTQDTLKLIDLISKTKDDER